MADIILKIIVLAFGIFALIESIITLMFPKIMIKIGKAWMKHVRAIKKVAIVEFIVALAFILVGLFIL